MSFKKIQLNVGNDQVVVFSDTHLSHYFDPAQFKFIKQAIEPAARVIINGDFWDHFKTNFDKFVNSKWQLLFPILKKKQTIYLFGNHDLRKYSDDRINLFSNKQADRVDLQLNGASYHIEHGHHIIPSFEICCPKIFDNQPMMKLGNVLQDIGTRVGKERFLLATFKIRNSKAKRQIKKLPGKVYICGHSHLAEYSPDKKYINNGVIRWGLGQYLQIDNGKLELIRSRYR